MILTLNTPTRRYKTETTSFFGTKQLKHSHEANHRGEATEDFNQNITEINQSKPINSEGPEFIILYQNIRSFRNKRHLIEAVTEEYKYIQAIGLTETWITASRIELLQMDNFVLASSFCRSNREGGGVCIMLRENIEFKERREIANMSVEYIFETCAVEIPNLNILLIVLYWPEKDRKTELFFESLTKVLQFITTKDKRKTIIIGGDLNTNLMEKSKLSSTLLNLMKSFNFATEINKPTRVTHSTSTCIDILFSNIYSPDLKLEVEIKDYRLSDHKGILVNTPKLNPLQQAQPI